MAVKIVGVSKEAIIIQIEGENFFLTPIEAFDGIKELERGLFKWHELTGKKVDEGKPA